MASWRISVVQVVNRLEGRGVKWLYSWKKEIG
jgi:hypothetical protein